MARKDDSGRIDQELWYDELGEGKSTILFIHGACSNSKEWRLVAPYLTPQYHLLMPDLPKHGNSKHIIPFTREHAGRQLADLIRRKGSGGKAHVVGFSLGVHLALELATTYPDVVDALFLSGYGVLTSVSKENFARGFWLENRIESALPLSLVRWLMDGTEITPVGNGDCTLSLCRDIAEICHLPADSQWSPWPARTLIIAAGKRGIVPSNDSLEDAKRLRAIALQGQAEPRTKAFTHPEMRHPWCLQAPNLFAETVRLWFEEGRVPAGFIEL